MSGAILCTDRKLLLLFSERAGVGERRLNRYRAGQNSSHSNNSHFAHQNSLLFDRARQARRLLNSTQPRLRLTYHYTNEEEGKTLRRHWITACQACSLKGRCTTGKNDGYHVGSTNRSLRPIETR